MAYQSILTFVTMGRGTLDITADITKVLVESKIQCGLVHVFVQHTSCSLTITENADPDVRYDLDTILSRLAPDGDQAYQHDVEGPDDMAAHARSVLTDSSLTVPAGASRLLLGTWQGIFLWEHRISGQRRQVVVTVLGT